MRITEHEGQDLLTELHIEHILLKTKEFQEVFYCSFLMTKGSILLRWKFPKAGWAKLNMDESAVGDTSTVGYEDLLRQ